MPSTFEILSVEAETRPWTSKKGTAFVAYKVEFQELDGMERRSNGDKPAELSRPATSPAPVVGEKIQADLETEGGFGPKLREPFKGGGGKGGSYGKSPEERKSIARQHSQEMALMHVKLMAELGNPPENYNATYLKQVVDWFTDDVETHAGKS